MRVMNKRGQVFLIAAVIVVGLIFGASRTLNYVSAQVGDQESFYDLADELDFEAARVLDYGIVNQPSMAGIIAQQFLDEYTENIVGEEIVYIFKDTGGVISAIHYTPTQSLNAVTLSAGSLIPIPVKYLSSTTSINSDITYDDVNEIVTVRINSIDYVFNLRKGQGLYFVIIKDDNEERIVAI